MIANVEDNKYENKIYNPIQSENEIQKIVNTQSILPMGEKGPNEPFAIGIRLNNGSDFGTRYKGDFKQDRYL